MHPGLWLVVSLFMMPFDDIYNFNEIRLINLIIYVTIYGLFVSCLRCRSLPCHVSCESEVLVAQSCLTLCDPMDCSPPGSFVHGILQARILAVSIPFPRGSSRPRDQTQISYIAGRFFTI